MNTSTEDRRISKPILYVGLDVHKETTSVALAEATGEREVRSYGTISSDLQALQKLMEKLRKDGSELRVVYEAGPCGFEIARRLRQLGINCQVIAPSLTPRRPGDRRKNNRRDALMLARLHRAGELVEVHVPDPTDEALRDLCRARQDAMNDLRRSRQQLKAQLLRLGYKYQGKTSWNEPHERYLRELVMPHAAHKIVLEEYIQAIGTAKERVDRITGQIEAQALQWRFWPAVEALMCMRGFQVLSAVITLSELGDMGRFSHPGKLMSYLGLLPSEHLSGDDQYKHQGGRITKTGNAQVRWILTEAAQQYMRPPKVNKALSRRQHGKARRLLEISWNAQNRLHRRYRTLVARGKSHNKAVTAVARELAGFVWAIVTESQHPGSIQPRAIQRSQPQQQKQQQTQPQSREAEALKRAPVSSAQARKSGLAEPAEESPRRNYRLRPHVNRKTRAKEPALSV